MIDTSPWSSCSCLSPWLGCSGYTFSSTGPSVSPFRDFFFQPSQYGIVLIIWGIVLMNLLISNFLSCLQWQWVPSKPVAPSAVFAYLGLSGDICLHYQPSPLFPYVRLTTYRREPKCSSGGKENMKLTQLGDLSFFQFRWLYRSQS